MIRTFHTKRDGARIFRTRVLPESRLHELVTQKHPHAVILAGQPGAGKSGIKSAVVDEFDSNLLPVDTDDQRRFVPGWEQMAKDGSIAFRVDCPLCAAVALGRLCGWNNSSHTHWV